MPSIAACTFAVCLMLISSAPADEPPQTFRETLEALELSPAQRRELAGVLREFRGRYDSEAFRVALLGILTAEQVDQLEERNAARRPPVKADDLQIARDLPFAILPDVDPKLLSLDIYRKRGDETPRPVMVMIHGGGWRIGDKAHRAVGLDKARLFVDEGYVYVSINYRLSPAVTHPAHVEDVAAAVAWIHANIAAHGGDPEQIFLMGHSAGAHLAALVSIDATKLAKHKQSLSVIKGTILLDGAGYDVAAQMKLDRVATSSMYRDAFTENEATQRDASPIHHVAADKGIPPFLIIPIASRPDSRLQSQQLAKTLTDAGYKARVFVAEGKTHGSLNNDIGTEGDRPTAEILAFLKQNRVSE